MKLFSGASARTLTIRFVADVFKANSDIKKTGDNVNKLAVDIKSLNREVDSFTAKRNMDFASSWSDQGFGWTGVQNPDGSFGLGEGGKGAMSGSIRQGLGPGTRAPRNFQPPIAPKAPNSMSLLLGEKGGAGEPGEGTVGKVNQAFMNLMGRTTKLGSAFASIPEPIKAAVVAIGSLGYVFNKLIKMGTFVEARMVQMEVLTGSSKKSRQLTGEAIDYSVKTPFTPSQVFSATSTAVQFGFKDVFKKGAYGLGKDKTLADIAAGLGSVPDLAGKMMGMDRMMNAIMRGDYRLLRPVRGMVQPAYEKAKATGSKVGTPLFNQTFVKALGKIPAIMNLAEKQSNTVAGLWSTIAGFADVFWISLSGVTQESGIVTFWSQLRDMLKDVRDTGLQIMNFLSPLLVEVGAGIMSPFKFIWDVLKQIARIVTPLFKFLIAIGAQLWKIFLAISKFVKDVLLESLKFVIDLVMIAANGLDRIFGFVAKMDSFISTIVEFVVGIQSVLIASFIIIRGIFRELTTSFDRFWNNVVKKFKSIKGQDFGVWEKIDKIIELLRIGSPFPPGQNNIIDKDYRAYLEEKVRKRKEKGLPPLEKGLKPIEKTWLEKKFDNLFGNEKEEKKGKEEKSSTMIDSHDTHIYAYSTPRPGGKSLTGNDESREVELNAENFSFDV